MKLPSMLLEQVETVLRPLAEKWLDWMNVNRSISLSMSQRHGNDSSLKVPLEESTARTIWWLVAADYHYCNGRQGQGWCWSTRPPMACADTPMNLGWLLIWTGIDMFLLSFWLFALVIWLIGCWSVFSLRLGTHVISVIMNLGQEVAVQRIVAKIKMGDS